MFNALKLFLVAGFTFYECTLEIVNIVQNLINNFNSNYCTNCKTKIHKVNLYKKIKNIFYLTYKDAVCIDCFLKRNKLEEILPALVNFKCDCCENELDIVNKNYNWIITCKTCSNEVIDFTLNRCLLLWEEKRKLK